jgi:hypothetical protein
MSLFKREMVFTQKTFTEHVITIKILKVRSLNATVAMTKIKVRFINVLVAVCGANEYCRCQILIII